MASDLPRPRVSVLIPNFNNGRASARDGTIDFIGQLLQSLWDTLHDDPTPSEILVYDDGSTDDSLTTLRQWVPRTWPDGRPFIHLVEAPHCGVLAINANKLSRMARGEFLARLDGDIVCLTRHWVSRLSAIFDQAPARMGMVGPKQLRPDLKIHAFGDFVLHPHGYIHYAAGMPRDAVQHPLEVDHVMGCFYCCRKAVFDDIGGYDEDFLRGQTIDFGLRARLRGWTCLAHPDIEYIHQHSLRKGRATKADTADGIRQTLDTFEQKWGFSRLAPDLEEVRRRYAGTGLMWNRLLSGPGETGAASAPTIQDSQWGRFATDPAVQAAVNLRLKVILDVIRQSAIPRRLLILGAGEGLLLHLLARQGVPCLGLDDRAELVQLGRQCMKNQTYAKAAPQLELMQGNRIPLPDGQVDMVLIDGMLERWWNPVGLLNEAWRVLAPCRLLTVVSRRTSAADAAADPSVPVQFHRLMTTGRTYAWSELLGQVQHARGWQVVVDPASDDRSRDMVVIARRVPRPAVSPDATPALTSHAPVPDAA